MKIRISTKGNGKLPIVKAIKALSGMGLKNSKFLLDEKWTDDFKPEYIEIDTDYEYSRVESITNDFNSRYSIDFQFKDVTREKRLKELFTSENSQKFLIITNKAIYGVSKGHYNIDNDKDIVSVTIQNGYREYNGEKVEIENRKITLSFINCVIEENI